MLAPHMLSSKWHKISSLTYAASRAPAPRPGRTAHRVRGSSGGDSGGGNDASSTELSLADAYSQLGLKEGSSYEAVLSAKNAMLARYKNDRERQLDIEMAYDRIFSSQLKARLSGDLSVSNRVRFADVAPPRRAPAPQPAVSLAGFVSVDQMQSQAALTTSATFGGLAAWALAQGLLASSPAAAAGEVPGFQLALGAAAAIYLFRQEKRLTLPKAAGLTVGGLIVGTLVGSAVESWLRVDLIPLGSLSSPGTVVGEFALAGLWAATFFLA
jgi:hypothetical protein